MSVPEYTEAINRTYGRTDLGDLILVALRSVGKDVEALTPDDLAPVDQFHTRGKPATLELVRRAELRRDQHVLDVGGGIGGPARTLASEVGCHVTVLDLTDAFCQAGEVLTARTGLSDRVTFRRGDALDMPFADASFDVVWTQHSSMNIEDKERLYAECRRVLRPGGRLALHEVMAGSAGPPHYPVPWARDPAVSFLRPPEAIRSLLTDAGWRELVWVDTTAEAVQSFQRMAATAAQAGSPPLGVHLLLGPDAEARLRNQVRNLTEGRVTVIQAVFERS